MKDPFERSRRIDGAFNFRDVGHYDTRDGRRTRPAVLFRSGALHRVGAVRDLGVRTVLDLRGPNDIQRDAERLGELREHSEVRRISLPLIPPRIGDQTGHQYLNAKFGSGISAERYGGYLEIGTENLRAALHLLASPGAFPAVVHCTAGKDRTGVVIALVLDVLGVSHDTIVADYALSNATVSDLVSHLKGDEASTQELSESDMARYGAPAEAMSGFLERLHQEHGSARGFLSSIGLADEVFARLEAALLTDG